MVKKIYELISNKIFQLSYKYLTFFAILIILYFQISYNELLETLNLNVKSFFLSIFIFLLLFLVIFFIYKRWDCLLKITGNQIHKDKIITAVLYGNLSSELNFLGIFFSRAILIMPEKIILKDVIVTTFLEKLLSAFFLFILTFPGIFLLLYRDNYLFDGFSKIVIFAGLLLLLLLFLMSFFIKKILPYFKNNRFYRAILPYASIINISKPLIYTVFIQLLSYFCLILIPYILGIEINYFLYFLLLPIIIFFSVIPISISPWGWRELIFILVMKNIDLSNEESFAISIFYGLICLINSIIAVLLFEIYLKIREWLFKNNFFIFY